MALHTGLSKLRGAFEKWHHFITVLAMTGLLSNAKFQPLTVPLLNLEHLHMCLVRLQCLTKPLGYQIHRPAEQGHEPGELDCLQAKVHEQGHE